MARAIKEQERQRAEDAKNAPRGAIWTDTDRAYVGWNPGLGMRTHGRAHTKAELKKRGFICVG